MLGRWSQNTATGTPLDLRASKPSLPNKFQVNERPCFRTGGGWGLRKADFWPPLMYGFTYMHTKKIKYKSILGVPAASMISVSMETGHTV